MSWPNSAASCPSSSCSLCGMSAACHAHLQGEFVVWVGRLRADAKRALRPQVGEDGLSGRSKVRADDCDFDSLRGHCGLLHLRGEERKQEVQATALPPM